MKAFIHGVIAVLSDVFLTDQLDVFLGDSAVFPGLDIFFTQDGRMEKLGIFTDLI